MATKSRSQDDDRKALDEVRQRHADATQRAENAISALDATSEEVWGNRKRMPSPADARDAAASARDAAADARDAAADARDAAADAREDSADAELLSQLVNQQGAANG